MKIAEKYQRDIVSIPIFVYLRGRQPAFRASLEAASETSPQQGGANNAAAS